MCTEKQKSNGVSHSVREFSSPQSKLDGEYLTNLSMRASIFARSAAMDSGSWKQGFRHRYFRSFVFAYGSENSLVKPQRCVPVTGKSILKPILSASPKKALSS